VESSDLSRAAAPAVGQGDTISDDLARVEIVVVVAAAADGVCGPIAWFPAS